MLSSCFDAEACSGLAVLATDEAKVKVAGLLHLIEQIAVWAWMKDNAIYVMAVEDHVMSE